MRNISYNFDALNSIFAEALDKGLLTASHCRDIKRELNLFFKDSRCDNVYYTNNTSKPFFGMLVCPRIYNDKIYDYLMGDSEDVRFSEYSIEIDSHIFNPLLGLRPKEITAMLLHEVGHVVNDNTPIINARRFLDEYMAKNNDILTMHQSMHYKEVLAYALADFVTKDRSVFYCGDVSEVMADDFVRAYGYGHYLESGMQKILSHNAKLYQGQVDDKFAVMTWVLSIYRGIGHRKIPILRTLNRAKSLASSQIEKKQIENVLRHVNMAETPEGMVTEGVVNGLSTKVKSRMRKMRIDSMKSLEDDYYEINMRVRNVEDEDDALYLMRQVNTRISLISDFIDTEDLRPDEKKRWQESLDKYLELRTSLSNTMVYKNKNYGIFVQYPDIVENRY